MCSARRFCLSVYFAFEPLDMRPLLWFQLGSSGNVARAQPFPWAGTMTEVLFYHLEHQPLERVLPSLVEKTLERGWRAVVQAGSEERIEALDMLLWTWREDSFLPHGTKR